MSCTDHPWIEWWTEFKRLLRLRQPRICYRSALLYNPRRARTHKILRAEKTERSTWASHWRKELAKAFTYWKWWKCIVGLYKLIRERRISPCSQNFSVSHPQLLSSRWGRFYVIFRFFCLLWWFSFFFFFLKNFNNTLQSIRLHRLSVSKTLELLAITLLFYGRKGLEIRLFITFTLWNLWNLWKLKRTTKIALAIFCFEVTRKK